MRRKILFKVSRFLEIAFALLVVIIAIVPNPFGINVRELPSAQRGLLLGGLLILSAACLAVAIRFAPDRKQCGLCKKGVDAWPNELTRCSKCRDIIG